MADRAASARTHRGTTGCLTVNALAGSPIQWFWLLIAPVYVTLLIAGFLWVRLAPSA